MKAVTTAAFPTEVLGAEVAHPHRGIEVDADLALYEAKHLGRNQVMVA